MKHIITEGGPYYSHGTTDCYECWNGGKILAEVSRGDYQRVDPLTKAEISFLLETARQHNSKNKTHFPIVHEYRAGENETRQWEE